MRRALVHYPSSILYTVENVYAEFCQEKLSENQYRVFARILLKNFFLVRCIYLSDKKKKVK